MANGYLIQHVYRQRVPEVKPRWAAASRNIVRICKRLPLDAEPSGGTLVDRLRVSVSDLVSQAVAVPLVYADLESVVTAVADTPIVKSRCNVRIWCACLWVSGPRRQSGVVVSADVEPPGARTYVIDVHGGGRIQLALHTKIPLHGIRILDVRIVEPRHLVERRRRWKQTAAAARKWVLRRSGGS